jgi:adenylate cyclase
MPDEINLPDLVGRAPDGRKLVAIVYTDIVGYSRLIGLDDIGTLERLRALRRTLIDPAIHEHGGKIVQTGGDSLLIVFDSIDGAVRCALSLQQQVPHHDLNFRPDRAIRFRVGINIGDVIADGTDLHGDGVSVAARLQAECPPGGICVSRAVRDHVHDRLDPAFDELGTLSLKNIIRPVEAFVLRLEPKTIGATPLPPPADTAAQVSGPYRRGKSIVVLPFTNMSGDSDQEYFCDGITEEITTALSRFRWLFVISRNSAFTYKGRPVDVRNVAKELKVDYVLEGSVRKAGGQVRISAQLTDALAGTHIWGRRFEGLVDEVFTLQDRVAESIAQLVVPKLRHVELERVRRKPPENMDAYDLYLRALPHFYAMTQEASNEALRLLQQSIDLDGNFAPALITQALLLGYRSIGGWTQSPNANHPELLRLARAAARSDPDDPDVLAGAAHLLSWAGGEYEEALYLAERACTACPNSVYVWTQVGSAKFHAGEELEAVACFRRALQLDPFDPMHFSTLTSLACALISTGEDAEAAKAATRAVSQNPKFAWAWRILAASLALTGRPQDGAEALATVFRLDPHFTLSSMCKRSARGEIRFKRIIEALRSLGAPED